MPDDVRDAFGQLSRFVSNHEATIDFHGKNMMMRGDQLVLNDVVADLPTLSNAWWGGR
jgi:hypothetical protein